MTKTKNKKTAVKELVVQNELTINSVQQHYDEFLKNADHPGKMILTLQKLQQIDLSGIQLLMALIEHRKNMNAEIEFKFDISNEMTDLLLMCGFNNLVGLQIN